MFFQKRIVTGYGRFLEYWMKRKKNKRSHTFLDWGSVILLSVAKLAFLFVHLGGYIYDFWLACGWTIFDGYGKNYPKLCGDTCKAAMNASEWYCAGEPSFDETFDVITELREYYCLGSAFNPDTVEEEHQRNVQQQTPVFEFFFPL